MLTIKKLKEIIQDLPDNTIIMVPFQDHSFRECSAYSNEILYDRKSHIFSESSGDEEYDRELGVKINAVIIE